jgi:hypothetical protein
VLVTRSGDRSGKASHAPAEKGMLQTQSSRPSRVAVVPMCVCRVPDAGRPASPKEDLAGRVQQVRPDFVYRYRLLPPHTTVAQFVELAVIYGRAASGWRFDPTTRGALTSSN